MFDANSRSEGTIVLNFGASPQESFPGFVGADQIPEYEALDGPMKPLQLSHADEVRDDAHALFEAFGLI